MLRTISIRLLCGSILGPETLGCQSTLKPLIEPLCWAGGHLLANLQKTVTRSLTLHSHLAPSATSGRQGRRQAMGAGPECTRFDHPQIRTRLHPFYLPSPAHFNGWNRPVMAS